MEAMDERSVEESGQQYRAEEVRRPEEASRAEEVKRAGEVRRPAETTKDGEGSVWDKSWFGGAVLILIGAVFLLRNVTGIWFDDWWALFIAIPGVVALASAWSLYQRNGNRLDGPVLGAALAGVFPLLVAAIFLFDLDWGRVWPLFLIAAGLLAMAPRTTGRQKVSENGE